MSLSSDKLNGHPNPNDPNPGKRSAISLAVNGWPGARRAAERKEKAGTPAEQKRRVDLAAKNRARAIQKQRNVKMLEIYGIPEPLTVPGEKKLFSRWLKEKKDRKTRFENLADFCLHIMKNYGDEEKDDQWRAYLAAADPQGDADEKAAEATLAAMTAIDTQSTNVPALAASELPAETFHEEG
jgi:hypothetical protein